MNTGNSVCSALYNTSNNLVTSTSMTTNTNDFLTGNLVTGNNISNNLVTCTSMTTNPYNCYGSGLIIGNTSPINIFDNCMSLGYSPTQTNYCLSTGLSVNDFHTENYPKKIDEMDKKIQNLEKQFSEINNQVAELKRTFEDFMSMFKNSSSSD